MPASDQGIGPVGTDIKKGSSRGGGAAEPLVFRYAKQIRKTGKDPRRGARRETRPAPGHNSGQALIDLWLGSPDIGSAVNRQRLSCRRQRLALRAWPDFFNRISLMLPVQSHPKKYSASFVGQITAITSRVHPGKRGVSRSSRTRGWMRWTQRRRARSWSQGGVSRERSNVAQTTGVSRLSPEPQVGISPIGVAGEGAAYGEVVWFWHPLLMSSQRRRVGPTGLKTNLNPLATVTRGIRRREEHV
jgi:hypothetical protein